MNFECMSGPKNFQKEKQLKCIATLFFQENSRTLQQEEFQSPETRIIPGPCDKNNSRAQQPKEFLNLCNEKNSRTPQQE